MKPLLDAEPGKTALVVAHPDDETIGAGGQIAKLTGLRVLVVTDGAPRDLADAREAGCDGREAYARLRRRELEAALAIAGVGSDRIHSLGVADQEASIDMRGLALRIADRLRELGSRLVLTHAYEMGHPDHDATCLAVHAAAGLLPAPPRIVEFPSYHMAPDGGFRVGAFPPGTPEGTVVPLGPTARATKRRMLAAHASQARTLSMFGAEEERFRAAPAHDFMRPAHGGGALYDRFAWGMDSARWRALAAETLRAFGRRGA
jgi:LmbE family N-acetylglucosaminyl deacetylase